jgi:hypothetical protein
VNGTIFWQTLTDVSDEHSAYIIGAKESQAISKQGEKAEMT